MKNRIFHSILPLICLLSLIACFSARQSKGPDKNKSSATVEVPNKGIIIEAKYDPRLDSLIPGYKIVTVALTNNGIDTLRLNPLKDRWEVTDAYGKNRRAINSVRIKDPSTWGKLPDRLKQLIEYPIAVSMNYSETIDLFFPQGMDLTHFRAISFYAAERNEKYDAMASLESENQIPINPPSETPANPKAAAAKKSGPSKVNSPDSWKTNYPP